MALTRARASEVNTSFQNPDKGWIGYAFRPKTRPNLASPGGPTSISLPTYATLIYTNYLCWTDFEPAEGSFDWTPVDALLNAWPTRKLHLGFGGPNEPTRFGFEGFPDWLRAACPFGFYDSASPTMYMPDYKNATFQTKFANLMAAFATRYYDASLSAGENNWMERIPSIDICIFGRWGEWHSTNYSQWSSDTERFNVCKALVDIYYARFNAARGANPLPEFSMNVIGSSAYPNEPYDPVAAFDTINTRGTAMVRRAVGCTPTNVLADERAVIARNVVNHPMAHEFASSDGGLMWHRKPGDPSAQVFATWQAIDQALELWGTTLGWYKADGTDFINCATIDPDVSLAEVPEAAACTIFGGGVSGIITGLSPFAKLYPGTTETLRDYAQRRLGYRFHISRHYWPPAVAAGGTFRLTQRWFQTAVAKLYHQHWIRARLVGTTTVTLDRDTSSLNAHAWNEVGPCGPRLIVSTFTIPGGTPTGTYELQFAVVDINGDPAMNLANGGKITAGLEDPVNEYSWYRIGAITVT